MFTIKATFDFFGIFPTRAAATDAARRIHRRLPDIPVHVVPLPDGVTPKPIHPSHLER